MAQLYGGRMKMGGGVLDFPGSRQGCAGGCLEEQRMMPIEGGGGADMVIDEVVEMAWGRLEQRFG